MRGSPRSPRAGQRLEVARRWTGLGVNRWSTDPSKIQLGDAIFYWAGGLTPDPEQVQGQFDHVGLIVKVSKNNDGSITVVEDDGDFGGQGKGTNFAMTSHVLRSAAFTPDVNSSSNEDAEPIAGYAIADTGGTGGGGSGSSPGTPGASHCYKSDAYCWGVDSAQVQTTTSLDSVKSTYGSDPDSSAATSPAPAAAVPRRSHPRRSPPSGHGRSACCSSPTTTARSRPRAPPATTARPRPRPARSRLTTPPPAASALGISGDKKVAIFADIESPSSVSAEFIKAYADEIALKGYRAGFYGSEKDTFARAFCDAASTSSAAAGAAVWSSSRDADGTASTGCTTRASSLDFKPDPTMCSGGSTVVWQYGETVTDNSTDRPRGPLGRTWTQTRSRRPRRRCCTSRDP